MAVRDGPDDVLRPERRVAAEEDLRVRGPHGHFVDHRHVPLVELDADVALDPGEGVLLPDRHQHVVAFEMLIRFAGRHQAAAALGVALGLHLLEHHAGQLAVLVGELLRHQHVEDRDVLVHGVVLFPGRRLHFLEAGADDDLHVLAAQPARRTAAVHRGVAAAQHDHALADAGDVAERHGGQPVDADMDIGGGFVTAGNGQVAAARRAATDEDRVVVIVQQRLQAVDPLAEPHLHAEVGDVADFLVDDVFGEAEFRDLAADHAARARVRIEQHQFVAERRQVARDGQRGGAGTDRGRFACRWSVRRGPAGGGGCRPCSRRRRA